jgi:hypothetical protein
MKLTMIRAMLLVSGAALASPLTAQQAMATVATVANTRNASAAAPGAKKDTAAARTATAGAPAVRKDTTTTRTASAALPSAKKDTASKQSELAYRREVFAYDAGGRRDPFVSLVTTGVLRPTIADLSLVGIAFAARTGAGNAQSIAIFRDRQTKEQYRVRVGQPLGRMRVASIEPRRVVFAIDEFGVSRQESISMGDSTRTITPTRAP